MTYEKLKGINILFRHRQEQNKDTLAIVTGEKGDGKSNYSYQQAEDYVLTYGLNCEDCGHEWMYTKNAIYSEEGLAKVKENLFEPCPKCTGHNVSKVRKFNFKKYMAYDNEDVNALVGQTMEDGLPPFSPLIGDEAINWAFTEDWNKAENTTLKKRMYMIRTKRLTVFADIPDFIIFDKKYRNLGNYWVRILGRNASNAIAIFFRKSKGEILDKWHLKEFQELMRDYFDDTPMDELETLADKIIKKHPCAFDYFKIPPIPKEEYEKYQEYRNEKVWGLESKQVIIDKKELLAISMYNLFNKWHDLELAVSKSKFKRPTIEMITNFLFTNPVDGVAVLTPKTISNWLTKIQNNINIKKQ